MQPLKNVNTADVWENRGFQRVYSSAMDYAGLYPVSSLSRCCFHRALQV